MYYNIKIGVKLVNMFKHESKDFMVVIIKKMRVWTSAAVKMANKLKYCSVPPSEGYPGKGSYLSIL